MQAAQLFTDHCQLPPVHDVHCLSSSEVQWRTVQNDQVHCRNGSSVCQSEIQSVQTDNDTHKHIHNLWIDYVDKTATN